MFPTSYKQERKRSDEQFNQSIHFAMTQGTVITQDEDCVEEAICHHIIESVPTEDGGTEARCRNPNCSYTPSAEELEDYAEDEAIRNSDNKSYFERV